MTKMNCVCKPYFIAYVKRILPSKSETSDENRRICRIIRLPTWFVAFSAWPRGTMRSHVQSDSKSESLCRFATLNLHPERVSDALFLVHPFFDPRDLLQVRYEMLRRVIKDGHPVGTSSAAFGFSRMSFSQLHKRFTADGLFGLLPQTKGPRRSHKLSAEVLTFVENTLQAEPDLRLRDLPGRVQTHFGFSIHLRSIERALSNQRKKHLPNGNQPSNLLPMVALRLSVCSNTKSYATRHWRWPSCLDHRLLKWPSLSVRGLRPGWQPIGAILRRLKTPAHHRYWGIWFRYWPIWC